MALRIAIFGQAAFGKDVLLGALEAGHEVVGVYAPPEGARPDPLAAEAVERGLPLFRHKRFRRKGEAIAELVAEHAALGAELNLLAYVTAILPPDIVDQPRHGSLCFHPSLLPRFRGGNAIQWQLILGEREAGVTVFRPDAGVDTGPIAVQKGGVAIRPDHNAASLYFDDLYALGVEAMLEAVAGVDAGTLRYQPQDESLATFQGLVDAEVARIDWERDAVELDRLARGCDPNPGAWALRDGEPLRLFDSRLVDEASDAAPGSVVGVVDGRLRIAARGGQLAIGRLRIGDGKKVPAGDAGLVEGERLA